MRRLRAYTGLADCGLDQVAGEHIAGYVVRRQSDPLLVSSINRELQVLRRLLRLVVEWGVVEHTAKVLMIRGENHREFVLTPEEEARYLSAASEPLVSIATVLADTGLRPERVLSHEMGRHYLGEWTQWNAVSDAGNTAAARRVIPMTFRVRTLLATRWEGAGRSF